MPVILASVIAAITTAVLTAFTTVPLTAIIAVTATRRHYNKQDEHDVGGILREGREEVEVREEVAREGGERRGEQRLENGGEGGNHEYEPMDEVVQAMVARNPAYISAEEAAAAEVEATRL